MPEGHTIHRLARDHHKWFAGKKVHVESPQGRFSAAAARISGKHLAAVEAHGKHLFYHFGRWGSLHIHLGLYGKFRLHGVPLPQPRGAVRVRLFSHERGFDLNGPNQCELLTSAQASRLRGNLGQDPLRRDSNSSVLWNIISNSRKPIGDILLDQSIIAGIGNIYRAEILFLLGINPQRLGKQLNKAEFLEIWSLTKQLMKIGVKYDKIITIPSQSLKTTGSALSRTGCLNIYKKSICPRCQGAISVTISAARKLYSCTNCQR
jgi:endonuclease VIII